MDLKERREFYYELYRDELQRRDGLDGSLTMPATGLSFLFLGLWHYSNEPFWESWKEGALLPQLILAGGFLCFAVAAYRLLRAFWGTSYTTVPEAEVIEDYLEARRVWRIKLKAYQAEHPEERTEVPSGTAESDLDGYLIRTLGTCTKENFDANSNRASARYRGVRWMAIGVALLGLLSVMNWLS